jgi:DNA-binding CsgD family transcriptional regulator
MVPDYSSVTFYMLVVNYLSYYIISLVILFFFIRKTKSFRLKSQSRIIFIAIIITITSYNVEPFLAPLFFNYHTYGQAPVYSVIWITLMWYAMMKYRFLGVDRHYLNEEIMDSLSEMVILLDIEKNVIMINKSLSDKLGGIKKITSLDEIFIEHEMINRLLDSVIEKPVSSVKLNLILPGQGRMLLNGRISLFKDHFNDTAGFVIIGQSVACGYPILRIRGITEREYELIELIMSGNSNKQISSQLDISLRTVETHITNIYDKLGLKKRTELINFCTDIFSSSAEQ